MILPGADIGRHAVRQALRHRQALPHSRRHGHRLRPGRGPQALPRQSQGHHPGDAGDARSGREQPKADGRSRLPLAHAPAGLPGSGHRRVRPALGAIACHQGLHRHGGAPGAPSGHPLHGQFRAGAARPDRGLRDQFATGQFRDPLLRLASDPEPDSLPTADRDWLLDMAFRSNHRPCSSRSRTTGACTTCWPASRARTATRSATCPAPTSPISSPGTSWPGPARACAARQPFPN